MKKLIKAFTLVELVIVIAVIGILSAILIPVFGSVIKNTHVNADHQEVSVMNFTLATYKVNKKIETEKDIQAVVNSVYGENAYSSLMPKSAKYGYHYWYDIRGQKIILATTDEMLKNLNDGELDTYSPEINYANSIGRSIDGSLAGGEDGEFEKGNLRTQFFKDYFFLDKTGSSLAEIMNAIELLKNDKTVDSLTLYKNAITSVYALSEGDAFDKGIQNQLIDFFKSTSIVTENGTFRYSDVSSVNDVIFAKHVSVLTSKLYTYSYDESSKTCTFNYTIASANQKDAIMSVSEDETLSLPSSVTRVSSGALWFNLQNGATVTLNTLIFNESELLNVFKAYSTNANIKILSGSDIYTINANKLCKNDVQCGTMGFDNIVTDFELKVEEVEGKVKVVDNFVYVMGGYSEDIIVTASNFTFYDENASKFYDITFASNNPELMMVTTENKLRIESIPEIGGNYTAVVTATAVAGGTTKSLKFNVVRINGAQFKLGNLSLNMVDGINNDITLDFTGNPNDFYFTDFIFESNYGDIPGINCEHAPSITYDSDCFTIVGNTLTIKPEVFEVSKVGEFTVKICHYLEKTFTLTINDLTTKAFELKFENTDKYLYRVGNANEIKLGSLFSSDKPGNNVTLEIFDASKSTDNGSYVNIAENSGDDNSIYFWADYTKQLGSDWANSTIKFSGEGIAVIRISNANGNRDLKVEVVNATNVTQYSELKNKNSVLLNDIAMSEGGSYALTNATLYGNGFVFDVTKGKTEGKNVSSNYLVNITNATLDNVQIKGSVYNEFNLNADASYNNALVLAAGNSVIANSFLSNCASPVRVREGVLLIENTTLKGGIFSNLDIRGGKVTLNNVTTINQADANDKDKNGNTVVGLGITFYYENVNAETELTIKGDFNQYNYVNQNDANKLNSLLKPAINKAFSNEFKDYQYTDENGVVWLNTGILLMMETVSVTNNINHTLGDSYKIQTIDFSANLGFAKVESKGQLFALRGSAPKTAPLYQPSAQYPVKPKDNFVFDLEDGNDVNYNEKVEGNNDYSYYVDGKYLISFDEGESFNFNTNIFTATKWNNNLTCTVTLNGVDYTGKSITFDKTGEYELIYSYVDEYNYFADLTDYAVEYQKTLKISVTAVKAAAKNAEFIFANGGSTKTVTIGNNIYVMPEKGDVTTTVSGVAINVKTIEIIMSDGKTSHSSGWYAYFPVFDDTVTIYDYAEGGTGTKVTYNVSTTSMPKGLSVVGDPASLFKYQSGSNAGSSPVVKNNKLVYSSAKIEAKRSEYNQLVQYSYTDNKGQTYYYYVNYHAPAQTYNSCFTPETLITLADGSQKRVDELEKTDKILTWDFFKGEYVAQDIVILVNHGKSTYNVVNLTFDNGKSLEIIGEHGVFNYDLNKFVYLTESNASEYIGHNFVEYDNKGCYKLSKLISVSVSEKYTEAWSITSAHNSNALASEMLTVAPPVDFYNWIEMGDKLLYDSEKFASDIEKYGLYTYEQFDGIVTYEQFLLWGGAYLKIPVEKGIFTFEYIVELIELYSKWMV